MQQSCCVFSLPIPPISLYSIAFRCLSPCTFIFHVLSFICVFQSVFVCTSPRAPNPLSSLATTVCSSPLPFLPLPRVVSLVHLYGLCVHVL